MVVSRGRRLPGEGGGRRLARPRHEHASHRAWVHGEGARAAATSLCAARGTRTALPPISFIVVTL